MPRRRKRETIGIKPGDQIRTPDRATARWYTVVRVGLRKDGTRYVTLRTSRFWRALGLPARHVMEWSAITAFGFGLRRRRPADDRTITGTQPIEVKP